MNFVEMKEMAYKMEKAYHKTDCFDDALEILAFELGEYTISEQILKAMWISMDVYNEKSRDIEK